MCREGPEVRQVQKQRIWDLRVVDWAEATQRQERKVMNAAVKNALIITAKHAVNAALVSLAPVIQDHNNYQLHTKAGLEHLGLLVGGAVVSRELVYWMPKVMQWSQTTALTIMALLVFAMLSGQPAQAKTNHALATHHTIKATSRPFKVVGHAVVKTAAFSFAVFDATVIDPLGVALQAFADGVDMFVAAPLEAAPEPLEAIGDGVHYVYEGIDYVGQQLAK